VNVPKAFSREQDRDIAQKMLALGKSNSRLITEAMKPVFTSRGPRDESAADPNAQRNRNLNYAKKDAIGALSRRAVDAQQLMDVAQWLVEERLDLNKALEAAGKIMDEGDRDWQYVSSRIRAVATLDPSVISFQRPSSAGGANDRRPRQDSAPVASREQPMDWEQAQRLADLQRQLGAPPDADDPDTESFGRNASRRNNRGRGDRDHSRGRRNQWNDD
jgi:hypothetical protein